MGTTLNSSLRFSLISIPSRIPGGVRDTCVEGLEPFGLLCRLLIPWKPRHLDVLLDEPLCRLVGVRVTVLVGFAFFRGRSVACQLLDQFDERWTMALERHQLHGDPDLAQANGVALVDECVVGAGMALEEIADAFQLDAEALVCEAEADEEERARDEQSAQGDERRLVTRFPVRRVETVVTAGGQDEPRGVADAAVEMPYRRLRGAPVELTGMALAVGLGSGVEWGLDGG